MEFSHRTDTRHPKNTFINMRYAYASCSVCCSFFAFPNSHLLLCLPPCLYIPDSMFDPEQVQKELVQLKKLNEKTQTASHSR